MTGARCPSCGFHVGNQGLGAGKPEAPWRTGVGSATAEWPGWCWRQREGRVVEILDFRIKKMSVFMIPYWKWDVWVDVFPIDWLGMFQPCDRLLECIYLCYSGFLMPIFLAQGEAKFFFTGDLRDVRHPVDWSLVSWQIPESWLSCCWWFRDHKKIPSLGVVPLFHQLKPLRFALSIRAPKFCLVVHTTISDQFYTCRVGFAFFDRQ